MTAQKKLINLLPKDDLDEGAIGKILKWALSIGRFIVIGTELVVIGSFLTRFSLDRQMTDLNEAIDQKVAVISSYGDLEAQARTLQQRLDQIAKLNNKQLKAAGWLETAAALTPADVFYKKIELTAEQLDLDGTALSDDGLRTLLATLNNNNRFTEVVVKKLNSEGDAGPGIDFDVELRLTPENSSEAGSKKGGSRGI